jgi:putative transposase
MARPLGIEFAGALWHITASGNERRDIVVDADDRRGRLEILGQVVAWAGWRLHAKVLRSPELET